MMDDNIAIDPVTKNEFSIISQTAFDEFIEALGDVEWEEADYQDIAEIFFFNGFLRGCLAMTENEEVKETLYMMRKEIDYQTNKK